jgi:hypothetical protein
VTPWRSSKRTSGRRMRKTLARTMAWRVVAKAEQKVEA